MIRKPVLSRLLPAVFLMTAVSVCITIPVFGQNNGASDTTTTPVAGVPHDYLGDVSDIVNPANGALSIRIKAPVPHERGVNWPTYMFSWDSNDLYTLTPTWQGGSTGSGYSTNYQFVITPFGGKRPDFPS